ncbi:MAG: efflux RND transporter periplasmic adaptor subunit [Tepidisphaeraceae bacterium]
MASGIVESQGSESSSQEQGSSRSKMVQRLLTASANLPQFINDLLTTQAVMVAGTEAAGFATEAGEQGATLRLIAHIRPDESTAEMRAAAIAAFQELLKPCIAQGRDGAIEIQSGDNAPEPQYCLITLLRADGQLVAATAVITRCRNLERAQQRLMSMQLVAGYFDLFSLRRNSEQAQIIAHSHQHVLQLATAVATAEGFESAAMNLCNELATRTGASRVSLGWFKGQRIRVKALSHTEQFDKKQELVKLLETVMEECVDQEEPVHFDPEGGGTANVSRSAQILSRGEGGNIVLSLPLRRRADVVGAITLEFPPVQRISQQAFTGLSVAVDLLAPQLYDRYQNDRWLITKAGLSLRELGKKIIGPQHMLAKVLSAAAVGAVLFLCLFKPIYHVSAPFQFEAIDKRKLEAPFDGYIKSVLVRPGDRVKKDQPLLTMDVSDIKLKLDAAKAEAAKAHAQYVKFAADPEKQADAAIAQAQIDAANAEARLYQDQIDRAQVKAPFEGLVLKGDLTDQVLAPKKQGDELFIVAANDSLRAELSVSERDIQDLQPGQRGKLATTSLPTQKYGFLIERIVPLGQAKEGDNVFTVYAKLDQLVDTWRPGMAGEARIDVRKRPVIWIWTHKLVDYVRLKLWI